MNMQRRRGAYVVKLVTHVWPEPHWGIVTYKDVGPNQLMVDAQHIRRDRHAVTRFFATVAALPD